MTEIVATNALKKKNDNFLQKKKQFHFLLQSAYNTSEKRNKFNEALEREKQNFKYKNPILPGHNPLIKLSSKVYFQTIKKTE